MKDRKNLNKIEKSSEFSSLWSIQEKEIFVEFLKFQAKYEELKDKAGTTTKQLHNKITNQVLIPTNIFINELSSLETVCKYLKENKNLKNIDIASLVGRDSKSVWQAYNSSKKKHSRKFVEKKFDYTFPVIILQNRNLSVLENIVYYLKQNYNLSYHDIAVLLKRDERTIWTVWNNILKKLK